MVSSCCSTYVKRILRTEVFHGNDDEYELKIPFFHCSNCGELISPPFEHNTILVSKLGGKTYE